MCKIVHTKTLWIGVVLVLVVSFWVYHTQNTTGIPPDVETGIVGREDVVEVVSETGVVKATQAVDMAFERGGRVLDISKKEGDTADVGDALVVLDARELRASLRGAEARLDAERLRLSELRAGGDTNTVAVSESSVESSETALQNAKENLRTVTLQQNQLVENAEKTLRTANLQAYVVDGEHSGTVAEYIAPTISGTYTSDVEGVYQIELYRSGGVSGASFRLSGLETGTYSVSMLNPVSFGTRGLYIQFPTNFTTRTTWEIPVPNTRGSTYLANLQTLANAKEARAVVLVNAESAIRVAEAGVGQTESSLTQVESAARDERVRAQEALVRQMEASVESAQIQYDAMTVRAPFNGIVTRVSTEVGQTVSPGVPAVSLISGAVFELTVSISEVDIEEVGVGDTALVTFDALDDTTLTAHVVRVAPNATLVDGVRVFEVTLAFDQATPPVRDGLSANIAITTASRNTVVAIPSRSIYENTDGKFVRVIASDDTIIRVPVTTGLRGSDGKTEILSGLTGGERIITFASESSLTALEK